MMSKEQFESIFGKGPHYTVAVTVDLSDCDPITSINYNVPKERLMRALPCLKAVYERAQKRAEANTIDEHNKYCSNWDENKYEDTGNTPREIYPQLTEEQIHAFNCLCPDLDRVCYRSILRVDIIEVKQTLLKIDSPKLEIADVDKLFSND